MIEVKNLVKRYGDFEAVKNVSFSIKKGLICGFLGPNGAGKSTTMNIITGCLAATSGEVTINGCDIYEDPIGAKESIGYLPEIPPLYTDMKPSEYLEFVGSAKGLWGDKLYKEIDRVIAKTGLGVYSERIIKNLSKGYRQRVGIAQAIMGNPEVIILDEPTVGLDPAQIIEIRELIKELGKEHTVILSSHILTEIAAVCDYVIIIAHGQIVASDTLENLTKLYEGKNYIDITVKADPDRVSRIISSIQNTEIGEIEEKGTGLTHARIAIPTGTDVREELFYRFADAKAALLSMEYEEVTLEKVFLELTGDVRKPEVLNPEDKQAALEAAENALGDYVASHPEFSAPAVNDTASKEAKTEPAAPAANEKAPAEKPKENKNGSDDDYKPLFG